MTVSRKHVPCTVQNKLWNKTLSCDLPIRNEGQNTLKTGVAGCNSET